MLILISLIKLSTNDFVLNNTHYIGITLISISAILYFKSQRVYKYLFGISLILGFFGLVDIFYFTLKINIPLLSFNPIFLILILIFVLTDKSIINKILPQPEKQDKSNISEQLVESFIVRFEEKSEEELKTILSENSGYSESAKMAAVRILKENNVL